MNLSGRRAPVSVVTFGNTSVSKAGAERLTAVASDQIIYGANEALHCVRKQNSKKALDTYLMYLMLDDTNDVITKTKKQKNSHLPARARANVSGKKGAERHLKYSNEWGTKADGKGLGTTGHPPSPRLPRAPTVRPENARRAPSTRWKTRKVVYFSQKN